MGTKTSSFGASKREGHDSSAFYGRVLAQAKFCDDASLNDVPRRILDRVFVHSAEAMLELPDNSVALMVTSPPYHVGKDYDSNESFSEYLGLMDLVIREVHRVLEPGGRMAVNVANLGRKPYLPLSHEIGQLAGHAGFHMRGEIIWVKGRGANGSCAFGSFASAKNPVLCDVHEYVLVFSRGRMDRVRKGENTISREDFLRSTLSVWEIPPASARSIGHPAPFPVELPRRLIDLYTFRGDVVLDPFIGSGSTAVAAVEAGRRFVGYEISAQYAKLTRARVTEARSRVGDPAQAAG
ncbi:MAG TPA: site-specific DNA-methyltransferase [Acidimicrobiales bacterium]|nr:site-specific DNA-methyltransferase [Acidimicrobiales bacterium]